ncbi:MAG: hypothetical protein ACP5O2_12540, partial [Bacteroidales bacterium]
GNPTITNNLFVVVRHRNHLGVLSNSGATLTGNNYTYDFSTGINQAYGGSAGYKEIGSGIFGMVSGDVDSDGNVLSFDFNQWTNDFGNTGYQNSDCDLDGNVFSSDFNYWSNNFGISTPILAPGSGNGATYRCMIPNNQ